MQNEQLNIFHNTTHEVGAELKEATDKAKTQDDLVLRYFKARLAGIAFTPSQIHDRLIGFGQLDKSTPLTSIRRAISNLTESGHLVKTTSKKPGPMGRNEYRWKLA